MLELEEDQGFSLRMVLSCDRNERIPDMNSGRLKFIQDELGKRGVGVSLQTVHRWYHGKARPRHQRLLRLAEVLGVSAAWLDTGEGSDQPSLLKGEIRESRKLVVELPVWLAEKLDAEAKRLDVGVPALLKLWIVDRL